MEEFEDELKENDCAECGCNYLSNKNTCYICNGSVLEEEKTDDDDS